MSFEATFNNLDNVDMFYGLFPSRYDDQNSFGNGTYAIRQRNRFNIEYTTNEANPFSVNARFQYEDEVVDGAQIEYQAGLRWQPVSSLSLEMRASYQDREGWLLHQDDQDFTQFVGERWRPEVIFRYFPSAYQQFQFSLQWIGINAEEDRYYRLPEGSYDLVEVPKPGTEDDSFSISNLNLQVRYRWQIAPLSDLFVVYLRGDRRRVESTGFGDLFEQSWNDPLGDTFIVKLRYRLGS